jgi:hypothetical protein
MTCGAMLQQLLEADLGTLDGRGDSPLARHLRQCKRCRAVARVLSSESRALALALPAREPSRRPVHHRVTRLLLTPQAGVIAVAAAILLYASHLGVDVGPVPVRNVSATIAPPPAARIDAPPMPSGAANRHPRRVADSRSAAVGAPDASLGSLIAPAAPITPTAFVTSPVTATAVVGSQAGRESDRSSSILTAGDAAFPVVVEPPAGVRAAVLRTSNPNITVVWLY